MPFLPQGYEPPKANNYFKIQAGENRIRAMGPAIVGSVYWKTIDGGARRPVRVRSHETIDEFELGIDQHGQREEVKDFIAFPVWNYIAKCIQIAEFTQKTIIGSIYSLAESEDWGDPCDYDLKITKTGSGKDGTKYSIMPSPKRPAPADAKELLAASPINMEALFGGGDPFGDGSAEQPAHTPARLSAAATAASMMQPTGEMTIKQLAEYAGSKGVTKEQLGAALKNAGLSSQTWNAARDSAKAKQVVDALAAEVDAGLPPEDEIPF